MGAPLPRGFVRLTGTNYEPLLIGNGVWFESVLHVDSDGTVVDEICGARSRVSLRGSPAQTLIRESMDEIQAALVAALGAQGADGPLTIVTNGSAFNPAAAALEQVRVALGVPAHDDLRACARNLRAEVEELRTLKAQLDDCPGARVALESYGRMRPGAKGGA